MISRILIGYDGSASSENAFDFGLDLAKRYGAEIHVVAVARPPDFAEEVETRAVVDQARHRLESAMAGVRQRVSKEKVAHHFHISVGHPAEQLVRYAEQHGIDHIVVGHRGHTVFERWLIGSVARQVMAYAHCAVTVVRT